MPHTPERGKEAKSGIFLYHRPADPQVTLKGLATSVQYLHELPAAGETVWPPPSHPLNSAAVLPAQVGRPLPYPSPDTAGYHA